MKIVVYFVVACMAVVWFAAALVYMVEALTVVAVIALVFLVVYALVLALLTRREKHRARRAALLASCDLQHRWVMEGDPRGVYGPNFRDVFHGHSYPQSGGYWIEGEWSRAAVSPLNRQLKETN